MKKSPCGSIRQTKVAFKHISQHPRPNPDQIWYKNIYFYMKNHENWENWIKNVKQIMFLISKLVRIGSGIFRNMFKSYFCLSEAPAGAFFSEKWHISRILDMSNPQKMTFKLLLSVGRSRRGFFFWKMTHFQNFGHVKSSKSVFFVKNLIFEVIKCQKSGNRWPKKQKNNFLLPLRQPPSSSDRECTVLFGSIWQVPGGFWRST